MTPSALEQQQRAFNSIRDKLEPEHRGEFVLFHDGDVVDYFKSASDAYAAGLKRFGFDGLFIIDRAGRPDPVTTSLSWDLGVIGGGEQEE